MRAHGDEPDRAWVASRLWWKLRVAMSAIGFKAVRMIVELYCVLEDPKVPRSAKATVIVALVYFISPLDVVPDLVPVVGYADDLLVLGSALTSVASHVTPAIKAKADRITRGFFS